MHLQLERKADLRGVITTREFMQCSHSPLLTLPYQKQNEQVKGLAVDPVRKTYWVYTDQSLFELATANEDLDVWKIYLQQGQYDVALRYAKVLSFLPRLFCRR